MNNPIFINGVELTTLSKNEVIYIAIKPICEALGLDYKTQVEKIKEDVILSQLWGLHPSTAADKKEREMICLPLEYIFGWVFSIGNQANETFLQYKQECYHVLYNYHVGRAMFALKKEQQKNELLLRMQVASAEQKSLKSQYNLVDKLDFDEYLQNEKQIKMSLNQ